MAVGSDVTVVLFQTVGKSVMATAIGNEIKKIRTVRVQGGFQSASAGITDWPGW